MPLRPIIYCSVTALFAHAAYAQETREMGAHEHGSGVLNVAVEGNAIAMELEVPGFDIVGFEYEAESDADKAAIETALATLGDPTALFALPDAAGCSVVEASAELHEEEHDHDEAHDHDDHEDHDEHAEGDHDNHEEHAEGDHDDHDEHEESHAEFHAEYLITCDAIENATRVEILYFNVFENAEQLNVQLVTDKGATSSTVTGDAPELDLTQAM